MYKSHMYTHTLSLSLSVYMLFLLLTIWFIDQGVSMIIRSTVVFISNDRHTHTHTHSVAIVITIGQEGTPLLLSQSPHQMHGLTNLLSDSTSMS